MKFLNFVEEAVMHPAYEGYIGGRIEVHTEGQPHAEREIRFFTKRLDEFLNFRDAWDLVDVSEEELDYVERTVAEKFMEYPGEE